MILSPPSIIKELIHIAYYDLYITCTYKTEFLILIKLEQLNKQYYLLVEFV